MQARWQTQRKGDEKNAEKNKIAKTPRKSIGDESWQQFQIQVVVVFQQYSLVTANKQKHTHAPFIPSSGCDTYRSRWAFNLSFFVAIFFSSFISLAMSLVYFVALLVVGLEDGIPARRRRFHQRSQTIGPWKYEVIARDSIALYQNFIRARVQLPVCPRRCLCVSLCFQTIRSGRCIVSTRIVCAASS